MNGYFGATASLNARCGQPRQDQLLAPDFFFFLGFLAGFFFFAGAFFAAVFFIDFLVVFFGFAFTFLEEDDFFAAFLVADDLDVFFAVAFFEVDAFFTVAFFFVVFFSEVLAFLAPPPGLARQKALTFAPSERVKAFTCEQLLLPSQALLESPLQADCAFAEPL